MWRHVDPVKWTDVSEESIASIFRVEKSTSKEPAWAGSSRLSCQSKKPSDIRTGRVGEWATWEINREERGRSAEKEGQLGAGGGRAGRGKLSGVGKGQGYQASIDSVATGYSCRGSVDLRCLTDPASRSGVFLRKQMRGFPDLLIGCRQVFATVNKVTPQMNLPRMPKLPRSPLYFSHLKLTLLRKQTVPWDFANLMEEAMDITDFWDVALCSLIDLYATLSSLGQITRIQTQKSSNWCVLITGDGIRSALRGVGSDSETLKHSRE
jgi:hypothetical protein